jgi:hypothetical protein
MSRDFVYWLRGYIELSEKNNNRGMTADQVKMINDHLDLVFVTEGSNFNNDSKKFLESYNPNYNFRYMSCSLAQ